MRAVAVVLAVLIGAYGLEPGALTTTLLLIMYALARYAAITGLAWYRFTRRRMVGITPVKLLDDAPRRMRAFQRVTLRIFDLPHHPRRLRQAVRTWREWRANREALEMNAAADAGVRGDGLANLHDPEGDYFSDDETGGDETPRSQRSRGGSRRHRRGSAEDSPVELLSNAIERSPLYAALESCALTRAIPPETLRALATTCAREVHVASGEDVYRGRVLEDELAILAAGTVAVGDDCDDDYVYEKSAGEPTVLSKPGTALVSLLDVLEGSQRVARGASAAPSLAPSAPPSHAGDPDDVRTIPDVDARSDAGSERAAIANEWDVRASGTNASGPRSGAASPARGDQPETARPGEPRTVTLKRLAEAAAAAHASVAKGGGSDAHGADSPAGSDAGGGVGGGGGGGAGATGTDDEVSGAYRRGNDEVSGAYPARHPTTTASPGETSHPPPPTRVDRPPSHIPPTRSTSATASASGHSPRSSYPATPTRGGSGLAASRVGAAAAAKLTPPGGAFGGAFGTALPFGGRGGGGEALEFSGGPGGLPRPRVRGGDGGCVLVVVPLADFHRAAGFQLGIQAAAMRLGGGYTALCHYLGMPEELGRLWVDAPGPGEVESANPVNDGGAASALARLLGSTAAAQVDKSALDYLLERRGYKPRRRSANYERPHDDDDDDIGVDSDSERDSLASSSTTRMDTGPTGSIHGVVSGHGVAGSHASGNAGRETRGLPREPPPTNGSGSNVTQGAGRAGANATVELEASELAPGELARVRGGSNVTCMFVERGSLEGYWSPPDGRHGGPGVAAGVGVTPRAEGRRSGKKGRARSSSSARGPRGPRSPGGGRAGDGAGATRAFVAGPGCAVGGFLLLTGQKAAMTIRAGPGGAVVAALPHSAVARLARAHPHVYSNVAVGLARRLRRALPARLWDRCGAEWCALRAGEALCASRTAMSHAGRHPEGVYVVATGCVRLGGCGGGGEGGGADHFGVPTRVPTTGADHSGDHFGVDRGSARDVDEDGDFDGVVGGARFLGPGEAVGEDTVLRGVDELEGDAHARKTLMMRRGGCGDSAAAPGSELSRTRAVRDAQLLWIPSAGLESLARVSPRAFVSLAWRMGARAPGRRSCGGGSTNAGGFSQASSGGSPQNLGDPGSLFSAGGISGARADHLPGKASTHPNAASSARHTTRGRSQGTADETPFAPRTVAVVPVSEGAALALDEFVAATHAALSRTCAARVADSALRLAEVGQAGVGPLASEATAHWLAQLEAANDVVILKADPFPSRWCVTCARHADAILLVAAAEDDDAPGPTEGHALQARLLGGVHGGGLAQRELVLLHNSTDVMPAGTRPWLEAFSVHRHHHIARAPAHGLAPAHAARLARSLRRQSVGLVLAGGGARGFAHVGVLMALEEEGVPVDLLGGTSMGSFVGGLYAKEPTALLTRIITRRLAVHMSSTWNQLMDLTVPVVSYFSGFRMNKVLEPLFRGAKIEDCWLPFFCMTLDLVSCVPIVHRNGTLWRYVRASMALVGFLPPLCDWAPRERAGAQGTDPSSPRSSMEGGALQIPSAGGNGSPPNSASRAGNAGNKSAARDRRLSGLGRQEPGRLHVLVDGGYVNNCPTDVMRAMGARIIVAVDVSGHGLPESRMKPWGDALSGWTLIAKSWLPQWLGGGPSCPTMAAMQSHLPYITDYANAARRWRTVDVMVRPVVANIPILAFNRYAEVVRAGHEAGLRAIRAWKVANPDALPILDDGMWRPSNLASGAGGGGFGGVTLREVGSKGRLVGAIKPGAGVGIGARLPSTETLVRGSGLLGASSSSYGGGMDRSGGMGGGNSSGDLLARGVDSEMVEAMERDPFGDAAREVAHGARIADPNPVVRSPDDYVERQRRLRLLRDADARRLEARRMEEEAASVRSPVGGAPEQWTGDALHDDEPDGEGGDGEGGEERSEDVNARDPGRRRTEQWLTRVGSAPREFLTPDQPRVRGRRGFS